MEQIHECEKKIVATTKLLKQANSGREQSVSIEIIYVISGDKKEWTKLARPCIPTV